MSKNENIIKRIEEIEKQLKELKLELTEPSEKEQKTGRIEVGDIVEIVNPNKSQEKEGTVVKTNYLTNRATVQTNKGNVVRKFTNLKRK